MDLNINKIPGTIVWISPFYNRSGFAAGSRATVTALHRAGIPVRIISVNEIESGLDDCDMKILKQLENTPVVQPITTIIYHVPSEEWLKFKFPEPNLRILATAFDCSNPDNSPPQKWLNIFAEMDQIWVQSFKEQKTFIAAGLPSEKTKMIHWPHHWVDNPVIPPVTPEYTNNDKPFRFLSIAMFQPRRRWDSLIEAFLTEFNGKDNVELYLKVSYPTWHPIPGQPERDLHNLICSLRKQTGSDATIIVDSQLGTRLELINLIDSCNTYVSTDTSPTAPICEARARERLHIVPDGVDKVENETVHIEIAVDPLAKTKVTREMLHYKHYRENDCIPKLHINDIRSALRQAYSLSPEERHKICQNANFQVPTPQKNIPIIVNAIISGWEYKQRLIKKEVL